MKLRGAHTHRRIIDAHHERARCESLTTVRLHWRLAALGLGDTMVAGIHGVVRCAVYVRRGRWCRVIGMCGARQIRPLDIEV
jgi:hypothetical protein